MGEISLAGIPSRDEEPVHAARPSVAAPAQRAWTRLRTARARPAGLLLATLALTAPAAALSYPAPGLDRGWQTGLSLARGHHYRFGRDLVFTYGPWGFIDYPLAFSVLDLALGTAFAVIAIGAFWLALVSALRPPFGIDRAALVATFVVTLCAPAVSSSAMLLVALVLGLLHFGARGVPPWLPAVAAAVAALLLQVKFSEGVLATAATGCGVILPTATATATATATRARRLVQMVVAYLLATVVWWFLMGQALTDFPYWVRHSLQVAAGYTDAMSIEAKPNVLPYLVVLAVVGTVAHYLARLRSQRPGAGWWCALLVAGLSLCLGIKEGTGRHGGGQTGLGYFYMLPAIAAFVSIGGRPRRRLAVLLVLTLLIGRNWLPATPGDAQARWGVRLQLLVDPKYRQQQLSAARRNDQQTYALSAAMRSAIGDSPTTVDPWETTVVWAYRLRWRPAPVFQTYSAYTAGLDTLNAASITDAPADQRVLRRAGGAAIDGRYGIWDPPRYVLAEVCDYRTELSDTRWLLLRKAADRCGQPRQVTAMHVRAGQQVSVPEADVNSLVTMSFNPDKPNLAVRLGRLLDKSFHPLHVQADSSYLRVPRDLADGPLIVNLPASAGWPAAFGGDRAFHRVSFTEPGTVRFSVIPLH